MKKTLQIILLSLVAANFSLAQSYTEIQDSLFQYLDKSNITTGVLYDRVFPWAELTVARDTDFPIRYSFAKQAWLELELANDKKNLLSMEDAKSLVTKNKLDG